jgi:O-antigen ligase/tetratricopeptide (TPR) repeat protein
MARMLAWVGVALGIVYLIFAGGGWWGIYSPLLRLTTMGAATLALVAWALVARRDPTWQPKSQLLPALLAALGSLAVAAAFSRVPRVSFEYLGYAVVLATLYLLLVRMFAHDFFRSRLTSLAVMLFVASVVGYTAQVLVGWAHWWSLIGRFDIPPLRPDYGGLTYNNPSAALTMVTLLGAISVGAYGGSNRRGLGVVATVLLAVGGIAVASGSRSGWLAIGTTAFLGAVIWLVSPANRVLLQQRGRWLLATRTGRVISFAATAFAVAAFVAIAPAILRRVFEGGEDLRVSLYTAALRIFASSPIVGTGPGTWVILRPAFTDVGEIDFYIPHAHDLYLQGLAELGLVGVMAGLVVMAYLVRLIRSGISGGDQRKRWWAWACGLSLLYFGLHQLLDSYANMPAFLLAAAFPVAFLDAATQQPPGPARSSESTRATSPTTGLRRRLTVFGAGVVLVSTVGLIAQELPALQEAKAVQLANEGNWSSATKPARNAAEADPAIASYLLVAGLAAHRAGDHALAESYFERVVRAADLPEAWLNLAAEQVQLGKSKDALVSVKASLRLGYQRPAVAMAAGALALELGDSSLARLAFASAIATVPSLAGDPWWTKDPSREALLPSVIEAAIRRPTQFPAATWEIPLMYGDFARAQQLLPDGDAVAHLAFDAWSGVKVSQEDLFELCADDPFNASALMWCARIADRIGDGAAGARYRETSGVLAVSLAKHGAELRVTESEPSVGQQPGSIADLWATYTYRRPGPWDILVPSLLHLHLE